MKIKLVAAVAALVASLAACGGGTADADTLVVGASPKPHADILKFAKGELEKRGVKLKITEITDYNVPNKSLADKSLDANFFQHLPFLKKFEESPNGTKLEPIVPVLIEPLAGYSATLKSIKDVPEGAKVAIPNDPSNEGRALALLAGEGLIKLKDGVGTSARLSDVTENPKKLNFLELEAAQLPRSLSDTAFSIINGNFALQAKLDPKSALVAEKGKDNPYANYLVTRPELKDDKRIKALAEVLSSQAVKDYITKTYDGTVLPA
ncbi:ABC transporter substrate-binding protein [Pseudonocardiaceae bacterium YIM PH 21723]|nr:ABC transporter substrate-binding protein [Pseudonocardiaceae bacterium YIM PH 21723]